ncbi:MAG: flagellar hook protein FlgE [Acidimicrobiales bacterium]
MATRSMLAAVSGINANETYLEEIANNIANADTVGYEEGTVLFGDLLSEQVTGATAPSTGSGGVNPVAVGSGTRVLAVSHDLSEGTIESTGIATDVAITGNGYLVVQDGGQQLFTRDGALTLDAQGDLTTEGGALIEGWQVVTGAIKYGSVSSISIPESEAYAARMTSTITVKGNLPADNKTSVSQSVKTFDALGKSVTIEITFTPTAATPPNPTTWTVSAATVTKPTTDLLAATVKMVFAKGHIKTLKGSTKVTGGGYQVKFTKLPPGFPTTKTLSLNFPPSTSPDAVTQFFGENTVTVDSQNGYTSGDLDSYSISGDGIIVGKFSNGETEDLGQIALASFTNPSGLEDVGNGLFSSSANSGQAEIGVAGTGVRGSLLGGELEQSNVSLSTQLTDLITAQEAYTANTKAISTSANVIQSLEQI